MKTLINIVLVTTLYFGYFLAMEETQEVEKAQMNFVIAASQGNIKGVTSLLEARVNINAKDNCGDRALIVAAKNGHKEIVKLLIVHGADMSVQDKKGDTALHWAAYRKQVKVVKLLLHKGADSNTQGSDGDTILMYAASHGYEDIVKLLIAHGAHINAQDNHGNTALHWAAANNQTRVVELLLNKGAHIDAQNNYNKTPLMHAARKGDEDVATLLLNTGANPNAKDDDNCTSLIEAASNGNIKLVALLLERGADIRAQSSCGWTALINAAERGHKEVVALLINKDADSITTQDRAGRNALDLAKEGETRQLLELCTLPQVRAYLSNPVEYIKKDAHRFATIGKGQTWLMVASIFGHSDVISFYKDYSHKYVNTKDYYSRTAFDYAYTYNLDSIATLINTFGTKIDQLPLFQIPFFTNFISYIPYIGKLYKREELLKSAVESGSLLLVNALLSIGAQPTLELAQMAQEKGYLKIMHRLFFSSLAAIPEYKRDPYTTLSGLFK